MDALSIALGALFMTLVLTAYGAQREGNERRDVIALGASGALCGLGALTTLAL